MKCRHCASELLHPFVDLGASPPSNAYLSFEALSAPETHYPLRVSVCGRCWLAQTEDFARADQLFHGDYAYFSSTSLSWLRHAESFSRAIIERLRLGRDSFVVEIAANDGYLLKNFVAAEIPCLGIEPTLSTANAAEAMGVPVLREFFGDAVASKLAAVGKRADLLIGNNVYAHVPNINEFTRGLKALLKPKGTITLEFPHLLRLIERTQFDTIYHEHFSYLSLHAVTLIFAAAGLRIWDVEELRTHGGSLRIYGCHEEDLRRSAPAVQRILNLELNAGLLDPHTYSEFQARTNRLKDEFLGFLIDLKRQGHSVAGYGAAAKGNTLLNYSGVRADLLPYICDAAESKQGKFMPGSRIRIVSPEELHRNHPAYVVIFPWNIAEEVISLHGYIRKWAGKFVTAVPRLMER